MGKTPNNVLKEGIITRKVNAGINPPAWMPDLPEDFHDLKIYIDLNKGSVKIVQREEEGRLNKLKVRVDQLHGLIRELQHIQTMDELAR